MQADHDPNQQVQVAELNPGKKNESAGSNLSLQSIAPLQNFTHQSFDDGRGTFFVGRNPVAATQASELGDVTFLGGNYRPLLQKNHALKFLSSSPEHQQGSEPLSYYLNGGARDPSLFSKFLESAGVTGVDWRIHSFGGHTSPEVQTSWDDLRLKLSRRGAEIGLSGETLSVLNHAIGSNMLGLKAATFTYDGERFLFHPEVETELVSGIPVTISSSVDHRLSPFDRQPSLFKHFLSSDPIHGGGAETPVGQAFLDSVASEYGGALIRGRLIRDPENYLDLFLGSHPQMNQLGLRGTGTFASLFPKPVELQGAGLYQQEQGQHGLVGSLGVVGSISRDPRDYIRLDIQGKIQGPWQGDIFKGFGDKPAYELSLLFDAAW
jgi:hypothetical protein